MSDTRKMLELLSSDINSDKKRHDLCMTELESDVKSLLTCLERNIEERNIDCRPIKKRVDESLDKQSKANGIYHRSFYAQEQILKDDIAETSDKNVSKDKLKQLKDTYYEKKDFAALEQAAIEKRCQSILLSYSAPEIR